MQDGESGTENAGCLIHIVAAGCVLLPFPWFMHMISTGIHHGIRVSFDAALNYTVITVFVHLGCFLLLARSITKRPRMAILLFVLWIPGILLNCLALFVLWLQAHV